MKRLLIALTLITLVFTVYASSSLVKKSKSGICHDKNSSYFNRTTNFKSFNTLSSCLDSGGRLPKKHSTTNKSYSTKKYSRSQFGSGWADLDKDCQNSRMEALISQSVAQIRYKSSKKCKVVSGKWISTFTGNTIYKASEIDIDHVVPLSWAWKHGANSWSKNMRVKFANDPANLLSVEASLNRQKGDKGLNNWLPPKNKCQYISRFIRVYKTYTLSLTSSELLHYPNIKRLYCGN